MSEGLGYGTNKTKQKTLGVHCFQETDEYDGSQGSIAACSPQRVGAGRLCFAIASGWEQEEPGKDVEMICDLGLSWGIPLLTWIS